MKKLILSLLLALGVAGSANAQSLGVGRCSFPNCDSGASGTYTATTSGNWTAWGASSYATIAAALDSLAVGMRAAYSAWTGQWSYVVDLTNRVYYDCTTGVASTNCLVPTAQSNAFLNIQRGFNNYYNNAGLVTNGDQYRMLVIGLPTNTSGGIDRIGWLDPVALCPKMPGDEARRCLLLAPSTTYVTQAGVASDWENGFPVGDLSDPTYSINLYLEFKNVSLSVREDTMTGGEARPTVVFQLGNAYGEGVSIAGATDFLEWDDAYPDSGNSVGPASHKMLIEGDLSISGGGTTYAGYTDNYTQEAAVDGTTGGGRPNGLPLNLNFSPTGLLGMWLSHANYIDMSRFHLRCQLGKSNDTDGTTTGDDVCFMNQSTNFTKIGSIINYGGTGLISYGSNQGWIGDFVSTGGKIGVQIGDPYSSNNWQSSWFCQRGFKILTTGGHASGFVTADIGKDIAWSSGETGKIIAVTTPAGGAGMTYRITGTNDATLALAKLHAGDTLTCTGCTNITTADFDSDVAAACGAHVDYSVGDLQIESAYSVEGNSWGNLVAYSANKARINGAWFEQNGASSAIDSAPSINIGAGVCSANHYEPCWNYCPASGTCNAVRQPAANSPWSGYQYGAPGSASATSFGDITLTTGNCKGGKLLNQSADTDLGTWSAGIRRSQVAPGVALGPQFYVYASAGYGGVDAARTKLTIEGCWGPTDIDMDQNDSSADCLVGDAATVACRLFVANASALGVVDASHAIWHGFGDPDYDLPGVWAESISATPANHWYENSIYPKEQVHCANVEALVNTNDAMPIFTTSNKEIVLAAACRCEGTCSTPATLDFQDQDANALVLTEALTCDDGAGAATWSAFDTGNLLAPGETLEFNTTGADPEGDRLNVCVRSVVRY